MRNSKKIFQNEEAIKRFEHVAGKVSDQYQPIYTSYIVEVMKPEFHLERGYDLGGTRHSVKIVNDRDEYIVIENSFDGSWAFRLWVGKRGEYFHIPLDLERVIHRGQKAKSLTENFLYSKEEVLEAFKNTRTIMKKLQETRISENVKKRIIEEVFKKQIKDGLEVEIEIASSYDTIYDYIQTVLERYVDGGYYLKNPRSDKVRKGRKKSQEVFLKMRVMNNLYKIIQEEYPEVLI